MTLNRAEHPCSGVFNPGLERQDLYSPSCVVSDSCFFYAKDGLARFFCLWLVVEGLRLPRPVKLEAPPFGGSLSYATFFTPKAPLSSLFTPEASRWSPFFSSAIPSHVCERSTSGPDLGTPRPLETLFAYPPPSVCTPLQVCRPSFKIPLLSLAFGGEAFLAMAVLFSWPPGG